MSAPVTAFVDVRGLRLAYHRWGDPKHPLLLCLHGFMDHGRAYGPVARLLEDRWCVVAPDHRGHGESGWVGAGGYYHFYDYFDDLSALVAQLGVERLGVVGHSMGGSIATGLSALLGPRVFGLVLLEGMGPPYQDLGDSVDRLRGWTAALRGGAMNGDAAARRAARRTMKSLDEAVRRLRSMNPRLPEARARELAEGFAEPLPSGEYAWRFDPLHRTPAAKPFVRGEGLAIWRAIQAPVLSLYGAESPWSLEPLAERHAEVPDVVAASVVGAGHNIHHDRPEVVAEAIDRWMRGDRTLPADVVAA